MTIEEIENNYAVQQGYESWDNLVNEKINEQRLSLYYDFNAVTDLIQKELLKKASKQLILGQTLNKVQQSILNTEIL